MPTTRRRRPTVGDPSAAVPISASPPCRPSRRTRCVTKSPRHSPARGWTTRSTPPLPAPITSGSAPWAPAPRPTRCSRRASTVRRRPVRCNWATSTRPAGWCGGVVNANQCQAVIWQTEQTPFGEVTQTSGNLTQPLRSPGQYADPETGYSYNYFRDYDPTVGRYVQSDPIWSRGGVHTYGYTHIFPAPLNLRLGRFDQ